MSGLSHELVSFVLTCTLRARCCSRMPENWVPRFWKSRTFSLRSFRRPSQSGRKHVFYYSYHRVERYADKCEVRPKVFKTLRDVSIDRRRAISPLITHVARMQPHYVGLNSLINETPFQRRITGPGGCRNATTLTTPKMTGIELTVGSLLKDSGPKPQLDLSRLLYSPIFAQRGSQSKPFRGEALKLALVIPSSFTRTHRSIAI